MVSEHDPTSLPSTQRSTSGPLAVRVELDGTGSASFDWPAVLDALTRALEQLVRGAIGDHVSIIGVRFVDADGRATTGAVPNGITLVGFTTTPWTREHGPEETGGPLTLG